LGHGKLAYFLIVSDLAQANYRFLSLDLAKEGPTPLNDGVASVGEVERFRCYTPSTWDQEVAPIYSLLATALMVACGRSVVPGWKSQVLIE